MATKLTVDTANKRFIINAGVTSLDAKTEFYSELKADWKNTDALWKFRFPILSIAGDTISGTKSISPYYSLAYGWRLQFPSADLDVTVDGNIITTEGDSAIVDNPGPYHHVVNFSVSADSLTQTIVTGGVSPTPAQIWAEQLEGTYTAQDLMKIISAVLAGKSTGAEGTTITFRDINDTTDRVVADLDGLGNRTDVTLDEA